MNLTTVVNRVQACAVAGIPVTGINSPFIKVDTTTALYRWFFCVLTSVHFMVGWVVGASARRFYLGSGLLTPPNLPPVFNSASGRNTYQGAFL